MKEKRNGPRIVINLSQSEHDKIAECARKDGLPMAAWLRALALTTDSILRSPSSAR